MFVSNTFGVYVNRNDGSFCTRDLISINLTLKGKYEM